MAWPCFALPLVLSALAPFLPLPSKIPHSLSSSPPHPLLPLACPDVSYNLFVFPAPSIYFIRYSYLSVYPPALEFLLKPFLFSAVKPRLVINSFLIHFPLFSGFCVQFSSSYLLHRFPRTPSLQLKSLVSYSLLLLPNILRLIVFILPFLASFPFLSLLYFIFPFSSYISFVFFSSFLTYFVPPTRPLCFLSFIHSSLTAPSYHSFSLTVSFSLLSPKHFRLIFLPSIHLSFHISLPLHLAYFSYFFLPSFFPLIFAFLSSLQCSFISSFLAQT